APRLGRQQSRAGAGLRQPIGHRLRRLLVLDVAPDRRLQLDAEIARVAGLGGAQTGRPCARTGSAVASTHDPERPVAEVTMRSGYQHYGAVALVVLLAWASLACQGPSRGETAGSATPNAAPEAAAAATALAPIRVRLSQPVAGLGYTSIYVARHYGYFADEGIDLEHLTLTTGGGPDTQALIAGDVDFGATATTILISAYQEGTPLLGVVSLLNRMNMHLAMRQDIAQDKGIGPDTPLSAKLAALKGLTIGVTRLGSLTDQVARYYVRRAGLAGDDVTILAVGTGTSMMAALDNRRVDAVVDSTAALGEAV